MHDWNFLQSHRPAPSSFSWSCQSEAYSFVHLQKKTSSLHGKFDNQLIFSGFFLKSVLKRGHFHHVNSTFWKQHHWETELTHLCVICFMFNKTLKIMSFSDLNPWCPCFFSYFQLYRFTFLWPSISSGKNTLFFGWRDKTCSDNFVLSLHSLFYLSQKIDGLYIVKTLWYQILFVVKY